MLTASGKREFVPRDQVFPYFFLCTVHYFYTKVTSLTLVLSLRIVLSCLYLCFFIFRNSQLESDICRSVFSRGFWEGQWVF